MNYFEAKKARKLFRDYKALTLRYWDAQPRDNRNWMSRDVPPPESAESLALREQINLVFPKVNRFAQRLGVSVNAYSYPAPAVGGPVIPLNMLSCVIEENQGHGRVSKTKVMDVFDKAIGCADEKAGHEFKKIINPIWWLIAGVAYIVRIPFLVLRAAGLPASVEEGIWAHVVKGAITATLFIILAVKFGLKPTMVELLRVLGK